MMTIMLKMIVVVAGVGNACGEMAMEEFTFAMPMTFVANLRGHNCLNVLLYLCNFEMSCQDYIANYFKIRLYLCLRCQF